MLGFDDATTTPRRGFLASGAVALFGVATGDRDGYVNPVPAAAQPIRIGRRVVTGVDAEGRSRIDSEEPVPANATWKTDAAEGMDFWVAQDLPVDLHGPLEPTADYKRGNRAPAGGVVGRLITWAPGFTYPRHTTPTLDFIVVLSGQLGLELDTGSCVLAPGDVLIQRGTAHSWRVVGPEACTFVGVMLDAASGPSAPNQATSA